MVGPGRVELPAFTMSKTLFPKLFPLEKGSVKVTSLMDSPQTEKELTTRPRAHKR